ncbi:unnamed protein product [Phytophthora fragariaefolia]|uniref:Unnamed protein product n=1 Tax=Phytophthora fragariaefolia TaxID=1490495 RepID=A0A9W6WY25_9STRA|nr:unnamed protein product [Phytophthora fragariaefolia]
MSANKEYVINCLYLDLTILTELIVDIAAGTIHNSDEKFENILFSDYDSEDTQNLLDEYWEIPIQGMPGSPVEKSRQAYECVMKVTAEDLDLELADLVPEFKVEKAHAGVPEKTTPEMEDKLRRIFEHHRCIFLGDGNAALAPAREVVCDLDIGDAKPVAQRPRSVAPHVLDKVYELLKKPLESKLIEYSESSWASPIVIVLKQNGVDIRMCIDYRVVIAFIKLSHYPLPLIDDLLIGFESSMWLMSLGMASGLWAVRMTERA